MIADVLKAIKDVTGLPINPVKSEITDDQIIYTETPLSDDGIKRTDRVELNIVCKSYTKATEIDSKIRKAVLSIGDEQKFGVLDINVNGGGTLTSEVGYHRFIYLFIQQKDNY